MTETSLLVETLCLFAITQVQGSPDGPSLILPLMFVSPKTRPHIVTHTLYVQIVTNCKSSYNMLNKKFIDYSDKVVLEIIL